MTATTTTARASIFHDTPASGPVELASSVPPSLPEWSPPRPGTHVGSFEVQRLLGHGAMGVVMKARDLVLDRIVAMKFVRPSLVVRGPRASLEAEAQMMAKVTHDNVTRVHAFGHYNEAPYFVMEYVEGRDLERVLSARRGRPLVLDDALFVLDAICCGVQAIHSAGTSHGDLKPANVMLGGVNRVIVTDFGAARAIRGAGSDHKVCGTPAYLAPELGLLARSGIEEDRVIADVYSLGVLAFELITGRLPFPTNDVLEMLRAHAYEPPPPLSEVHPALPPAFDEALRAALDKSPATRTPTAQRLRVALSKARRAVADSAREWRFVVADDEVVARSIAETILRSGFPHAEVICVSDGNEAVARILEARTTMALVDLDMPGRDGLSVIASLREHAQGRSVPVVIISGASGEAHHARMQSGGAAATLAKPVDPDGVLHVVRRLLYTDGM